MIIVGMIFIISFLVIFLLILFAPEYEECADGTFKKVVSRKKEKVTKERKGSLIAFNFYRKGIPNLFCQLNFLKRIF
jgi:hypothetical protein